MRYIILALFLVGCGGGDKPRDILENTAWAVPVPTSSCVMGFGFYEGGTYAHLTLCDLTDGTQALEVDSGDYVYDGSRLTTYLRKSTCPADIYTSLAPNYGVVVNGDKLSLSGPGAFIIFSRVETMPGDPSGTGLYTYGCFETDGYFYAMPLRAL